MTFVIPPSLNSTINDFTIGTLLCKDVAANESLRPTFMDMFTKELQLVVPDILHCKEKGDTEEFAQNLRTRDGDTRATWQAVKTYADRQQLRPMAMQTYFGTDVRPVNIIALQNNVPMGGIHFYSITIVGNNATTTTVAVSPFPIVSDLQAALSNAYINTIVNVYAYLLNNFLFLANGRRISVSRLKSRRPEIIDSPPAVRTFYDRLDTEVGTRANIKISPTDPNSYVRV